MSNSHLELAAELERVAGDSPHPDYALMRRAAAYLRSQVQQDSSGVPYQQIVDAYHEKLPRLPKVKALTEARRRAIRARWMQFDYRRNIEHWRQQFERASRAAWLMGNNNRGWIANFDFFLQDASLLKLEEGYYDPREAVAQDAAASRRDSLLDSIVAEHNRRQGAA